MRKIVNEVNWIGTNVAKTEAKKDISIVKFKAHDKFCDNWRPMGIKIFIRLQKLEKGIPETLTMLNA